MAGDWIKLETVTPDKPEVHSMAEMLGIDPDAVLGKLIRAWIWADQQTENGDAPSVTKLLLDRVTCAAGFTNAMLSVSWLTVKDGVYSFPNFSRHNGRPAKTRALTKNRMQKSRDANSVTTASPEKRREEIKNPVVPLKAKPKKPKPESGYSKDFECFWLAYPVQGRAAKPSAYKAWCKALLKVQHVEPPAFLIQRACDYATSPKAMKPDVSGRTFVKHAATWLNNAGWDDSPEAWGIVTSTSTTKSKTVYERPSKEAS